jgi:hypothetical protein
MPSGAVHPNSFSCSVEKLECFVASLLAMTAETAGLARWHAPHRNDARFRLDAIRISNDVSPHECGAAMGKLHAIGNATIRVYANDHLPPHFHVIAPDYEALIEIETLAVMRGELPPSARKRVMDWAADNRLAIAAEWNRINIRFPIA